MDAQLVPLADIEALPTNAKLHDIALISDSAERFGFLERLVINRTTGHLLSGHGRTGMLRRRKSEEKDAPRGIRVREDGEWLIPVDYVELPESEEEAAALVLNRAVEQGGWDTEQLTATLEQLAGEQQLKGTGFSVADVDALLQEAEMQKYQAEKAAQEEAEGAPIDTGQGEGDEEDTVNIFTYREDAIFPGKSNDWDIPDLRPDKLSRMTPHLVWAKQRIVDASDTVFLWGTNAFPPEAQGGVLGFFVDDERFATVWTDAVRIMNELARFGWGAVMGPDFSLWRNWPLVIQLFNLYRSRWCTRYWQEAGLEIIPALNWSDERTYEWAFKGIPKNAPVVAAQCRTLRNEEDRAYFLRGFSEAIRQIEPEKVLLYGGKDSQQWIEPKQWQTEVIYLESWTTVRRRVRLDGAGKKNSK